MTEQRSKSAGTEPPSAATSDRQPRFNRDERQADLLRYAAREVLDQGGFPISFERLACAANVSKALIYNYFPNQHVLGSALLGEALGGVDRGALRQAVAQPDLLHAARACALAYFELVSRQGPLLHVLLADAFLEQGADRKLFGRAAMLLLPLARRLKRDLRLSSREAMVIVQLLLTVPEEAGRKVFQHDADPELARRLCGETIVASLAALDSQTPEQLADVAASADFL
ncbi:TetR/AcrR family transcriptional regulator [Sphingomonas sp. So64.6b]|uniref:TetR/AcrR family transcriptional regulator n=1 Tax=Sphingomonas sp. So64.6b TaxID=2997354 RepID=UPI0015FED56A|nr:TetR/AcrR family transcriptional regulator [Sphingomonas sp. So64.6b]QNA85661.1 TetR/AcrR family transcriptional regulator [Sphingomonas sp. So64.6b]